MPTYAVTIVHNSNGKREEIEVTAPTVDDAEQIAAMRPNVTVGRVLEIDAIGFRHKPEPAQSPEHAAPAQAKLRPSDVVGTGTHGVLAVLMALLAIIGGITVASGMSADITVGNTVNLGLVADRTATILVGCGLSIAGIVGFCVAVSAQALAKSLLLSGPR